MAKDESGVRVAPEEDVPITESINRVEENDLGNLENKPAVEPSDDSLASDTDTEQAGYAADDEDHAEGHKDQSHKSEDADEPELLLTATVSSDRPSALERVWRWIVAHKKFSIPAVIAAILLLLGLLPFTRYALAGLVLTQQYSVEVVDAQTKRPVSSADIVIGDDKATTDGNGRATLKAAVGNATLTVSKKYYQSASQKVLVPIGEQKQPLQINLTATGRQVPLAVVNKISGKAIAEATIKALDVEVKTDKDGKAALVVPADKREVEVVISAKDYNQARQIVQVTTEEVDVNKLALTPVGKIYFLSNQSGKIDVVKANLDGTERTVVLAGTGKEDRHNTSLLASRDWRYLALHARRDSDKPKLYLIDTANDKLIVMDEGDAEFVLAGWSGHHFVYTVTRNISTDQPKRQALKSYNAQTGKLTTLDETRVQVDQGGGGFVYEHMNNVNILDNEIVYAKNWSSEWRYYFNHQLLDDKQAAFNSVKPDGKAKKIVKAFSRTEQNSTYVQVDARPHKAQEVYVMQGNNPSTTVEVYKDGQLRVAPTVSRDDFYNNSYLTYLVSPSGERSFWAEPRDGRSVFFLGNKSGENIRQLGALREYAVYGWFGDDYLLVSKNSSELYIMPATTLESEEPKIKIADYYRSREYYGYGYGYGGL